MKIYKIDKYIVFILKTLLILGVVGMFMGFLLVFIFPELKYLYWLRAVIAFCLVCGIISIFGTYIYSMFDRCR